MSRTGSRSTRAGLTLAELVIVVAILVVLAAVATPYLSPVADNARDTATGEEAKGLELLSKAEHRFEATGDEEQLKQAQFNRAAYLEHTGKKKEAEAVRKR